MKCATLILSLLLFTVGISSAQAIQGTITDEHASTPILYAHIGIIGTDQGTISDEFGRFSLRPFPDSTRILFSAIGYQDQELTIARLQQNPQVYLTPISFDLAEVTVQDRRRDKDRYVGHHADNRRFVTGWSRSISRGGIRAARVKLPNRAPDAQLLSVRFHLAYNGFDSLLFRFHFYRWDPVNKQPGQTWELPQDLFIRHDNTTGWVELDVREYDLIATDDFCVGIEAVRAYGNCVDDYCLNFSVALLGGKIYWRNANTGQWQSNGLGAPGFEVQLRY